ncbi:MAG: SPOR domain-containing protein [Massilia sp.]
MPEKKRARRRLVGAVALALTVAVGLPMVLDSEPKPLSSDIEIRIPSKGKASPLPPVAEAAETAKVAPADTLDQREEIVEPARVAAAKPAVLDVAEVKAGKPEAPKHEVKPAVAKAETKAEAKADIKPKTDAKSESKTESKPVAKAEPKPEPKPVAKTDDAARALAILEGKPAEKAHAADPAEQKYVLQVGAFSSAEKVSEVQGKLRDAGIKSFTRKTTGANGELVRIQVGPFSKEEADKMRAKLDKIGLPGRLAAG